MKKLFFAALLLIGANLTTKAQFEQGQKNIHLGVGLGSTLSGKGALPLSIAGEYGFTDNISGGLYLGYASSKETVPFFGDVKYSFLIIGARAAYHFDIIDNIDTYAGLMLSYNNVTVKFPNDVQFPGFQNPGAIGFSAYAGGRYNFNEKLGVFAELGYGISYLNLGLNIKL